MYGKTTVLGLGEEMEVAGLRGSEIKPIACSKSRKYRGGRGGGELDGKRYRKVLLHKAYRTQGGKKTKVFFAILFMLISFSPSWLF